MLHIIIDHIYLPQNKLNNKLKAKTCHLIANFEYQKLDAQFPFIVFSFDKI
jgi:hypothetical protein